MNKGIMELFEKLLKSTEIRKIDFKSAQYRLDTDHLKSKFVKDILCIANAPGSDGYIVLGVKAEKGKPRKVTGILYHHDGADLAGRVNSVVEVPIQFEYHPITYKGKECAIIHIPSSIGRPHWPKKDFGILKKHVFYTRRASGNAEASIPEVRQMCMETIRISDIAKQKANVSHYVVDELATLSMDERKSKMYGMLKSITPKIGLKKYRSMVSPHFRKERETEFALVASYSEKAKREYSIFMYPWSVKMDNILSSRRIRHNFLSPGRTSIWSGQEKERRISRLIKERLKISTLIHIAYKNIHTIGLENRHYQPFEKFANEMKESWGKVIKWEEYRGTTETCEFFMPNVSSKEELKDRLEQLFEWIRKNLD